MLGKVGDLVLGYLKGRPFWPSIEPFVLVVLAWGAAQVCAYQWLLASGSLRPSIGVFLASYFSMRITIVTLGIVAIAVIARPRPAERERGRVVAYLLAHRRSLVRRGLGIAVVVIAMIAAFMAYTPNRASHIRVRLMRLGPEASPEAVAYMIFELNRRQRHWYFDVDFRPFTEEMLTSGEAAECRADERPKLCQAEALAGGEPLIAITAESLGGAYFAEHRGGVSVISTVDSAAYEPLSTYEYLAYSLILQSIAIHLDLHGGGLPAGSFEERRISHGGVFQFVPEKQALKSSILAARLSPEEEALLLNRFGSAYVDTCASLLSMDWLYSDRVRGNLEKVFGATLGRP